MSRVGRDAAGIAWARTALAAPPRTPSFSLRISIARPFGTGSSAKTVDGLLPSPRSKAVLDEKAPKPQCQKMVRMGDLVFLKPSAIWVHAMSRWIARIGASSVPNFLTRSAKHESCDSFISTVAAHSKDFHGDFAQSINREQRAVAARDRNRWNNAAGDYHHASF